MGAWFLGLGRSPGGGHGNPLQYSYLENPMDRGPWRVIVHKVTKSWTRLKWLSTRAMEDRLNKTSCWKCIPYPNKEIEKKFQRKPTRLSKEPRGSNMGNHSVQFSSVAQSCQTLCNHMNRSMPGLPVHYIVLNLKPRTRSNYLKIR